MEVNESGVDGVEARQKVLWTNDRAVRRVPGSGDFLSDVMQAGKDEKSIESERMNKMQ